MWQALRKLGLSALSLFVSLAFLEVFLRLAFPEDRYLLFRPNVEYRFQIDPRIYPGIRGPKNVRMNELGFRGDTPSDGDAFRILAIGGSTTESFVLGERETWPRLLAEELSAGGGARVWVGNAGKSGINSQHHVAQARHLGEQIPGVDGLLLLLGVNDLLRKLKHGDAWAPLDPDTLLETTFFRYPGRPSHGFASRFAVWQIFAGGDAPWFPAKRISMPQSIEIVQFRRHRADASPKLDQLPELGDALRAYEANLEAIAALCAARGQRLAFATQPTLWREDLPEAIGSTLWLGAVGEYREPGAAYYSAGALARGIERFNDVLRRVGARSGALVIDLAAELPAEPSPYYDGMHFNERGSRLVARRMARHLRAHWPELDGTRP